MALRDRQGVEISLNEWIDFFLSDNYYRVAEYECLDSACKIATIWLGWENRIFQSSVTDGSASYYVTYLDEESATRGHGVLERSLRTHHDATLAVSLMDDLAQVSVESNRAGKPREDIADEDF